MKNDSFDSEQELFLTFEPSQKELEEYAQHLGMNPIDEPELLWIAHECHLDDSAIVASVKCNEDVLESGRFVKKNRETLYRRLYRKEKQLSRDQTLKNRKKRHDDMHKDKPSLPAFSLHEQENIPHSPVLLSSKWNEHLHKQEERDMLHLVHVKPSMSKDDYRRSLGTTEGRALKSVHSIDTLHQDIDFLVLDDKKPPYKKHTPTYPQHDDKYAYPQPPDPMPNMHTTQKNADFIQECLNTIDASTKAYILQESSKIKQKYQMLLDTFQEQDFKDFMLKAQLLLDTSTAEKVQDLVTRHDERLVKLREEKERVYDAQRLAIQNEFEERIRLFRGEQENRFGEECKQILKDTDEKLQSEVELKREAIKLTYDKELKEMMDQLNELKKQEEALAERELAKYKDQLELEWTGKKHRFEYQKQEEEKKLEKDLEKKKDQFHEIEREVEIHFLDHLEGKLQDLEEQKKEELAKEENEVNAWELVIQDKRRELTKEQTKNVLLETQVKNLQKKLSMQKKGLECVLDLEHSSAVLESLKAKRVQFSAENDEDAEEMLDDILSDEDDLDMNDEDVLSDEDVSSNEELDLSSVLLERYVSILFSSFMKMHINSFIVI